jgi:hypothetical protein
VARRAAAAGWKASAGQAAVPPAQVSATSQPPADARQLAPMAMKESAGQVPTVPLQDSTTSHAPAELRHTVPTGAKFSLQLLVTPLQVSLASQPRVSIMQMVPAGDLASGHAAEDPLQVSAGSQTPAEARQAVPAASKRLTQTPLPLQLSGASQSVLELEPHGDPEDGFPFGSHEPPRQPYRKQLLISQGSHCELLVHRPGQPPARSSASLEAGGCS